MRSEKGLSCWRVVAFVLICGGVLVSMIWTEIRWTQAASQADILYQLQHTMPLLMVVRLGAVYFGVLFLRLLMVGARYECRTGGRKPSGR